MSENEKILEALDKINKRIDVIEKSKPTSEEQQAWAQKSAEIKGGYIQDYINLQKELHEASEKDLRKKWEQWSNDFYKEITTEATDVQRRLWGLDKDPVIHKSELPSLFRKWELEKADTDKRTPAKEGEKGPEGTVATDPISKMFENARKGGLQ